MDDSFMIFSRICSRETSKMNSSGFRSLPAQLSATKSVPNLPFATSLLHRIGENVGDTLTRKKSNLKKQNIIVKQQRAPIISNHHSFSNKPSAVKFRNALNRKKSASLDFKVCSLKKIANFMLIPLTYRYYFLTTKDK